MSYLETLFVGVDPTSGRKDFIYAALDRNLNLIALADADMDELLAFLNRYPSVVLAVNAPSQPNNGLLKKTLQNQKSKPGSVIRGAEMRIAEHELRQRGVALAGTPSRKELCPAWVQVGFALYERLVDVGFESYPAGDAPYQWLETHPYACFCALLEQIPFPKPTLEGRLQRQLILHEKRLGIKDPMDFFVELTRFKLKKGILPLETIYSPEQLDVLVAAYTAWLAVNQPSEIMLVGDETEGRLILPAKELQSKY